MNPTDKWICRMSCMATINLTLLIDFIPHTVSLPSIYHFQAHNFGVPPVIVDSTPHPHHHHHKGSGGLKTGYFPPSNRVMPRVSRECRHASL